MVFIFATGVQKVYTYYKVYKYYIYNILETMAKAAKKGRRVIPDGATQENFNIRTELLERVKDLAYQENTSRADIYNRAIDTYLKLYERDIQKIKKRPGAKGLDSINGQGIKPIELLPNSLPSKNKKS